MPIGIQVDLFEQASLFEQVGLFEQADWVEQVGLFEQACLDWST